MNKYEGDSMPKRRTREVDIGKYERSFIALHKVSAQ
jgi:hypothetical protein